MDQNEIDVLLKEGRTFEPPHELVENSNVKQWMNKHNIKTYDELLERCKEIEWFWGEIGKELIEWYEPPKKTVKWTLPYSEWFIGGKCNIVHNALDRHIKNIPDKIAYIFEGEPGDVRKISYRELYEEVNRFANALKKLGLKKGERVSIYLPMIPELVIAMLACAKLGLVHSVVFSGFSSGALRERINDCGARVLITCNGFWRRGKIVPLKQQADDALKEAPSIEHVIVYQRDKNQNQTPWNQERDIWWHEIVANESKECKTEVMDSNDLLYILYTSGTTGKPKGVLQRHGGYGVGIALTLKWVFDIKEKDIWWCSADIGWVTGHSYAVYAPLILGTTSILYEGAPDFPAPDRWWEIIERHKVTIFYTSPTAIRMFMRWGSEWPEKHDLSSLRLLGSVGEPINPEAWMWYYENIGKRKCQIMDTWWQTESGQFCISPLPITTLKPGSATKPLPGIEAAVFDEQGNPAPIDIGGNLVLLNPWPGMLAGLYKNPEKYKEVYWTKYAAQKAYLSGDIAHIDKDGYFWVQGRSDDVLKVAGHRLSNAELESALVGHPDVVEAAVVGKPHEVKGESIVAFVVLRKDAKESETLRNELREHVAKEIGKIARPDEIYFVDDLPKTRSGKIMRRIVRAKVLMQPVGDTSTLMNPEAVAGLDKAR